MPQQPFLSASNYGDSWHRGHFDIGLIIPSYSTDPVISTMTDGNVSTGAIIVNTTNNTIDFYCNGSWYTTSGGSVSPLTTKGDLYTFSTVNDRLPVGIDGQVLSADSSTSTGLKWTPAMGVGTITSIGLGAGLSSSTINPITSTGTISVNTTQNINTLSNLTTNGFVKTSGGIGTLIIDTNTYITGNQTITLTGDITGSGTTGITTTISSHAVIYSKIQQVSGLTLLGNPSGSTANVSEITLGAGLAFVGTTLVTSGATGGTVTSVSTDSTLSGGPITSIGTLGINLANSNSWSASNNTFQNILNVGIAGVTTGKIQLGNGTGSLSNTVGIAAPANPSNYTITLPANGGTIGYVLSTDGGGITSWVPQTSGGTSLSVLGTLHRVSVTSGSTATIDIASDYVGQISITTLGILSVGTWNANIIGSLYGGTGVNSLTAHNLIIGNGTSPVSFLAPGVTGKLVFSNGTDFVMSTPTFPNASATTRKIIVSDGTNWIASTETYAIPGTSGNVLTSNGTNWVSSPPATSGTVTSISLGNLSPLFTSTGSPVTSSGTLGFSLSTVAPETIFGNQTSGTTTPSFFTPILASGLFSNQGTVNTVLHGNATGNPSWSAISLTADVSGILPSANVGSLTGGQVGISGLSATGTPSSSTFLRGDNTWSAATVNLTGPITSIGNATSIASQTGTGTKFVVDASPTIITPTFTGSVYGFSDSVTALSGLTNVLGDFEGSQNGFYQFSIRNQNVGNNASSDFVCTTDDGTNTTKYIDLGINNSGFSQVSWTINGADDGYLYTQTGAIAFGTASNKPAVFFTGGTLAANAVITLSGTGGITFNQLGLGLLHSSSGGVITSSLVGISDLSATGTPSSSTYLRGDNTWATISGSGTVTSVATSGGITGGTITTTGTISLASIAANSVLANLTGSSGTPSSALAYTSSLTLSTLMFRDTNVNTLINNITQTWTTTTTAAGTTTLTIASAYEQNFTGTTTQTLVLPVTSTLTVGYCHLVVNQSTGALTINSSGANLVQTMAGNSSAIFKCILASGTTAASWEVQYAPPYTSTNTVSTLVQRDSSGNFSAGTITANLTGTASTVTTNANLSGVVTSSGNTTSFGTFTSATLAAALSDETGTAGSVVFSVSPALTGTPIAPTASQGTNTTQLATTAFVGLADKIDNKNIIAATAGINSTETIVVKNSAMSANRIVAGTTLRITWHGTCTSTVANSSTFAVRYGTLGTTSDGLLATVTTGNSAVSGTSIDFLAVMTITFRTVGATTTAAGIFQLFNNGATGVSNSATVQTLPLSFTSVNTTTASAVLSATYKSAATTTTSTFQEAIIEFINL